MRAERDVVRRRALLNKAHRIAPLGVDGPGLEGELTVQLVDKMNRDHVASGYTLRRTDRSSKGHREHGQDRAKRVRHRASTMSVQGRTGRSSGSAPSVVESQSPRNRAKPGTLSGKRHGLNESDVGNCPRGGRVLPERDTSRQRGVAPVASPGADGRRWNINHASAGTVCDTRFASCERRARCRTGDATSPAQPYRAGRGLNLEKWAWEELNFRPHAYQACALTN